MTRKTLIATAAAAVLAAPAIGFAQGDDAETDVVDGPANLVQVDNSVDQTVRSRANIQVARASAEDTEAGNLAFAHSHDCTACQSLAAAYQAVFVSPESTSFSPQNVSVALNESCTGCGSFAYAYQYVVTADRSARLSGRERRDIRRLEDEASAALRSGKPYPEIDATLSDVRVRFRAIVDGAIERAKLKVADRESSVRRERDDD
jgi:hypothetical protein